MLIKFSSNAAGSFSMFGEDATALVKLMTGTGQQEGAVRGRAISDSLSRLQEGVKSRKPPAVERMKTPTMKSLMKRIYLII